jgi:poly(A) polymerase
MKRSTLRRFVGAPEFPLELELHRLDCLASHGSLDTYRFLQAVLEELQHEPVLPRPWVTGHDLIRLGLPEGPQVGLWHKRAYDAQLEQRFADRDALLRWLEGKIREAPPPEPRRPPGA